jgi:predicted nucleic acid-binding protein
LGIEDFASKLAQFKVAVLDAMVFIYHFESHPTLANLTQVIFERMEAGLLTSLASVICLTEIYSGPLRKGYTALFEEYKRVFATYPNLSLIPVTPEIAEQAAILKAKYQLRTPDAIHVATGLVHKAEIFVSNDEALRSIKELEVLTLSDFAQTSEK